MVYLQSWRSRRLLSFSLSLLMCACVCRLVPAYEDLVSSVIVGNVSGVKSKSVLFTLFSLSLAGSLVVVAVVFSLFVLVHW